MKKSFLLFTLAFLFLMTGGRSAFALEGGGTASNPWLIHNGELTTANLASSGYYKLVEPVSVSAGVQIQTTGVHFDGDDYLITITTASPLFLPPTGLNMAVNGATLLNVNFTYSGTVSVSFAPLTSTIVSSWVENCRLDPSAQVTVTGNNAGGLIGSASNSTIINCRSNATVTATNNGGVSNAGGLIGNAFRCTIDKCFATGNVSGSGTHVGGLIGNANGNTNSGTLVSNSYAMGNVTTTADIGAVVVGGGYATVMTDYANSPNYNFPSAGIFTDFPAAPCGAGSTDGTRTWRREQQFVTSQRLDTWSPADLSCGGLIGNVDNFSSVTNCYATGNITTNGPKSFNGHFNEASGTKQLGVEGGEATQRSTAVVGCDYDVNNVCIAGSCEFTAPNTAPGTGWSAYAVEVACQAYTYGTDYGYPVGVGGLVGSSSGTITNSVSLVASAMAGSNEMNPAYLYTAPNSNRFFANTTPSRPGTTGYFGGYSPVAGNNPALTAGSSKQDIVNSPYAIATYPFGINGSTWTIIEGKTYPLLTANLVDSCLKNDIKAYHAASTGINCSRYEYTVNASGFDIHGSLDYYPGGIPTDVDYYFTIDQIGNDTRFNVGEGLAGIAKQGTQFPYGQQVRETGSITYVPATPEAELSWVRMWAFASLATANPNSPGTTTTTLNQTYSYGNKAWDATGNEDYMLTTINPLPTATWIGYVDPYFNTNSTPLKHNTICYDYRDLGDGTNNIAAQYDSAYIRVEMTGSAPFKFRYDRKNIVNGDHADHLGDNDTTLNVLHTTGEPGVKINFDSIWARVANDPQPGLNSPATPWNRTEYRYYDVVFTDLPNHVDTTASPLPLGGSQPSYTGFNLMFADPKVADGTLPKDNNDGYYIEDGAGCISNNFYAAYDEVYVPYERSGLTPGGATERYDTVVVNPLPVMNFPYETWHQQYGMAADPNLRFSHNDTVVCEGETITEVVFSSPIINEVFNPSMHYAWESVSSDPFLNDYNGTGDVPQSDYNFDETTKPYRPYNAPGYLTSPDRDSIGRVGTDLLSAISYGVMPNAGIDVVPAFNTNDDHVSWRRNDANDGWEYGPKGNGDLRDTVSRSFIRVYPYFVNYKGGICFAKDKNYGYNDFYDLEYRGVTDYSITVNPRPQPTVDSVYQEVCNQTWTEPVYLGSQIRQGVDSVWYAWNSYHPSYGMTLAYDSISPIAVPQENNGTGAGAIFDPSRPTGWGAYPNPSDSIRSYIANNPNRVAIFDTIHVVPYFNNRKICVGSDTLIRYRINPTTTITIDVKGDTICDESITNHRLDVTAYGTDVLYNWNYRANEGEDWTPMQHYDKYEHFIDVDQSGLYKVQVIGACGSPWGEEVSLLFDKTPVWEEDLLAREQLCEGETAPLTVKAAGAKRYVWYLDGDSIADTDSYTITNAERGKDYGVYQVKALSVCNKELLSAPSRIWVVTPLTAEDLLLKDTPSEFIAGQSKQVRVGHSFGYPDVTGYEWNYVSNNGIEGNATFYSGVEQEDLHSPYVMFNQADSGQISVKLYQACAPNGEYYMSESKDVKILSGTGIDGSASKAVMVYPNPVSSELNVLSESAIESVTITDMNGRVIYMQKDIMQNAFSIAAGGWAKGSYIVTVKNATDTVVHKVLKK